MCIDGVCTPRVTSRARVAVHVSPSTCRRPRVTVHSSPSTCHLPPSTCHVSPSTCHRYVELFLGKKMTPGAVPRVFERVSDRWEVAVAASDDGFHQAQPPCHLGSHRVVIQG